MTQPPVLFASAIEGTFSIGLKQHLTPALRTEIRALGIDLDKKLLPAYPAEMFQKAIRLTQQLLMPQLPEVESEHRLGMWSFEGFAQTFVGRASVAMTRLIGPDRTLPRLAQSMKAGVNFMSIESRKLGPGRYELEVSEVGGLPYFYEGLFGAGIRDTRAKDVVVKVVSTDSHRCLYSVTWTP